MATNKKNNGVHVLTIPFPAGGHILPHMDLIHQLLRRGLTVTIVVTPKNLHYLNPLLSLHSSTSVHTLVLPFPTCSASPIPPGVEIMQDVSLAPHFVESLSELFDPLVKWFRTHPSPPVSVLSDMLLSSWVNSLASSLNIQNLSFSVLNPSTLFPRMSRYLNYGSEDDSFTRIHMGIATSWGLIFNSFTELDGDKMHMIKDEFIHHDRLWSIGPLLPIKPNGTERGGPGSMPQHQIIAWLDSFHVDKSAVYVGFGTQISLSKRQMETLASALEESGVPFIWAINIMEEDGRDRNNVSSGFEERVRGKGLVIKGWTPQLVILEHRAVGSYLTHCGWNSALEGLLGEVLLLVWPMQVDHFDNAKLLAEELGVSIRVCEGLNTVPDATKLARILSHSVSVDQPERARAMKLKETALAAIQKGGSSDQALDCLVQLSALSAGTLINKYKVPPWIYRGELVG
ncbi:UDP-Glycosyltransferase superfamily protein [Hibiscus syriacus]|uniref:UDP-Glycosyltransferase superfamily protein n=1 Tax=Hibiscus syriacus TaxID=106335 RepID=A0A6A3CKR6_HIBSY|nr:flavonol 7-O-rhamnosyltransferase-like [Hibiscus syriacus]KAE8729733.1 UDP-Glycosyltransferase superfamily protein [Hibiscus syriacus]